MEKLQRLLIANRGEIVSTIAAYHDGVYAAVAELTRPGRPHHPHREETKHLHGCHLHRT